ncbi:MAG: L,D-transpeptidase [Rhodospirillaceae bacterium]|nr:L,D-transpeptidase [Rhodospirillaceae bacterium]
MSTHVRAAEDAGDAATEEAVPVTVRNDVIGELGVYRTKRDDTLHEVARRFNLGFVELVAANPGVSAWLPGEGTEVVLPTAHILPAVPHEGIVINLPELRLYYFSEDGSVVTHPVGVGREGWETPLGITKVVRKKAAPAWYPPESIRAEKPELPKVVPAGPDNPLGEYALYFGWPRYLLHGTNKPYGVGRRVSSGCIRLYPEDIEKFFPMVPIGTKVMVINEPLKLGWANGMLYMEVHPRLEQANQIELEGEMEPVAMFGVADAVRRAAGDDMIARIDWEAVADAVAQRHGYPVPVLKKTDGRQTASKS